MARRRLEALAATGEVTPCAIASRHADSARRLAALYGDLPALDDYRQLVRAAPDAVLIEAPHQIQDEAALWALQQGLHLFIGGPLATNTEAALALQQLASSQNLVVEAGFEARYKPVWALARRLVRSGRLGVLTAGAGTALWAADPSSWYYDERQSAGMPLTHMSYCFINPLRWMLGEPAVRGASANRLIETAPGRVSEETCVTLLEFPGTIPFSLTASYVRAADEGAWSIRLFGSRAVLEILPDEDGPGALRLFAGGTRIERVFAPHQTGFLQQACAFVSAIRHGKVGRNTPADCLGDLYVVEAIRSAMAIRL